MADEPAHVASRDANSFKGWLEGKVEEFFREKLGPDIARDAQRYCPEDTGSLAASVMDSIDQETGNLIVSASGNEDRDYALYVETGHRIYHPSTRTSGPDVVEPQPFLRPALYQERDYSGE